ncbi:helix-turn-helix transcriptional regulator [Rhizobium lemnae]|uniref:AraC family transcriptional regulator n=1 Tax=Rhizobium lemnae TaxID=1214924 RepID=A0ABV8EG97_9HYPH|nr:AraC family transcriptional regulator [Rhizobium lemnae]MCJ8510170.1 helix-turn-helix transcriptional regulator [Rhizobium lemnae]
MLHIHSDGFTAGVRISAGDDPILLEKAIQLTGGLVSVRPKSQIFRFDHRQAQIGTTSVTAINIHGGCTLSRQDAADRLLVFLPIHGAAKIQVGTQYLDATPEVIVLAPTRQVSTLEFPDVRAHLMLEIPQADLRSKLGKLVGRTIHESLQFQLTLKIDTIPGRLLNLIGRALAEGLNQDMNSKASTLRILSDAVVNCLVELVWHNYTASVDNATNLITPKYIENAIAFMQANLTKPLTIDAIAAAVGVSPRSLQQGFKQFRETTPMSYLKELRLQAAHRELEWAPPGVSVSDIGRRWGFAHLGRFAAEYRERFGRAPSGTLKGL